MAPESSVLTSIKETLNFEDIMIPPETPMCKQAPTHLKCVQVDQHRALHGMNQHHQIYVLMQLISVEVAMKLKGGVPGEPQEGGLT